MAALILSSKHLSLPHFRLYFNFFIDPYFFRNLDLIVEYANDYDQTTNGDDDHDFNFLLNISIRPNEHERYQMNAEACPSPKKIT